MRPHKQPAGRHAPMLRTATDIMIGVVVMSAGVGVLCGPPMVSISRQKSVSPSGVLAKTVVVVSAMVFGPSSDVLTVTGTSTSSPALVGQLAPPHPISMRPRSVMCSTPRN